MARLVRRKERQQSHVPADDYFAPQSIKATSPTGGAAGMPWDIFAFTVDLEPILNDALADDESSSLPVCPHESKTQPPLVDQRNRRLFRLRLVPHRRHTGQLHCALFRSYFTQSLALPTPTRLLYRFARSAPELLTWVLSRCVVESIQQRNIAEAEAEGLQLADWFESERKDGLEKGRKAVDAAIEMSGSVWVRPRLDMRGRVWGWSERSQFKVLTPFESIRV